VDSGDSPIYFPLAAGQGCGQRCAFCDFRGLFPKPRMRDTRSIVEEIRTIPLRHGARRLYFTDDNLFVSRKRAREICQALIDADLQVRWRGMIRASIVDEEIADLMARSGCFEVLLGIESGDVEMLQRMRKKVTPEAILTGLERLNRHGINTKSTFLVGYPGETEASVQRTVDLLNAYPTSGPAVHRYMIFSFAVLPLSEVAQTGVREQYNLRGYGWRWKHDTMDAATADTLVEQIHGQLKPELSPSYVLEVPEVPGMPVDDVKHVYRLRNRLAALQRDEGASDAAPIWTKMEDLFARARVAAHPSKTAGIGA
jgi:radical SAM superfamily enzyme YgiQ (UPF0313 family)